MTDANVLTRLYETALGAFMRDVVWAFPLAEILHFLGLCLMFGSLLIVDLRVLGVGRSLSVEAVLPFSRFAMIGLAINTITGVAFVCSDPENYWVNTAFRWKIALVLLGALNALAFEALHRRGRLWDGGSVNATAKAMAAGSLACWALVIVLGRLLPYTGTGLG